MTISNDACASQGLFVLVVVHRGIKRVDLYQTDQAAWRALVEYVDSFPQDGLGTEEARVIRFFVDKDFFVIAEADATELEIYLRSLQTLLGSSNKDCTS